MRPIYFAILGVIIGGLIVYLYFTINPSYEEKIREIEVIKERIDTLNKTYTIYKQQAARIVTKYDTLLTEKFYSDTDCNRLLDTCIVDVYRIDSALQKCDYIKDLTEGVNLKQSAIIRLQNAEIKRLKFPINVYLGAGMGADLQGQVRPNVNLSIGYKIPIFK